MIDNRSSNDYYLDKLPSIAEYMRANCPIAFKVFQEPWSFNFYKLCSIIEKICNSSGEDFQEVIFFSRKDSYAFPTSEISDIELSENRIIIETTFLNLYGVNQILPEYFGNCIINNENNSEELKAFLDILHNRVTHLYYEVWKHFKLYYNENRGTQFLDSLGLCYKYFKQFENDYRNLQGYFIKRNINPNIIKGILKYYFSNSNITIKSFEKKAISIDNSFILHNCKLTHDDPIVLGTKLYSTNYDIKALVEVDSYDDYLIYLSDDYLKNSLLCLLKAYLDNVYHVKIYLVLNDNITKYCLLGREKIILGNTSFMGQLHKKKQILYGNI